MIPPWQEYLLQAIQAALWLGLFTAYIIKTRAWRRRYSLRSLFIEMTVIALARIIHEGRNKNASASV